VLCAFVDRVLAIRKQIWASHQKQILPEKCFFVVGEITRETAVEKKKSLFSWNSWS
jgi:hypothetical protein